MPSGCPELGPRRRCWGSWLAGKIPLEAMVGCRSSSDARGDDALGSGSWFGRATVVVGSSPPRSNAAPVPGGLQGAGGQLQAAPTKTCCQKTCLQTWGPSAAPSSPKAVSEQLSQEPGDPAQTPPCTRQLPLLADPSDSTFSHHSPSPFSSSGSSFHTSQSAAAKYPRSPPRAKEAARRRLPKPWMCPCQGEGTDPALPHGRGAAWWGRQHRNPVLGVLSPHR